MILRFPKSDSRSNGKPFNPNRPYLKQGAKCRVVTKPLKIKSNDSAFNGRPYTPTHVMAVRFTGSKDYDLIPSEFLKHK